MCARAPALPIDAPGMSVSIDGPHEPSCLSLRGRLFGVRNVAESKSPSRYLFVMTYQASSPLQQAIPATGRHSSGPPEAGGCTRKMRDLGWAGEAMSSSPAVRASTVD